MRIALVGSIAAASALAPAAAFAVDYLSAEEAARLMFPDAERFELHEIVLDAAQLQALDARGVRGRSARWQSLEVRRGDATIGHVIVDQVTGKFELIGYAVGIALDGTLKPVEILSYRESHGGEIRLPAWRRQFAGKSSTSTLRVGDDIANISGATLSCTHVTDGVRRIVAVFDLVKKSGGLR